ncbi:MAG TPA: hypothetical protein VGR28_06950 [Candidatus Thermoplasmatota archaeon]|nr:hypothetical protein [Candidatus Thermoplasmatota archaeon]
MKPALLVAIALVVLALPAASGPLPPRDVEAELVSGNAMVPCLTGAPPGAAVFEEGFESGLGGWSFVNTTGRPNLWHATTFAGNGSANDALFHGGPGRAYYGIENVYGGTYNTSRMRNQGELRSPPIQFPDGPSAILLNTKWHVEWDRAWVIDSMQLGYATGAARTPLCSFGNVYAAATNAVMGYGYYQTSPFGQAILTGCEYGLESPQNPCRLSQDVLHQDITFDLAPTLALWEPRWIPTPPELWGLTARVSLYFQTGDAIVDDAMGWMVDDVRVVALGP